MITISDPKQCTGCGACGSICPHDAINLVLDREGFRYPEIDMQRCVDCGLCEKACHMLSPLPALPPFNGEVYAACLKNRDALQSLSSGGVAWALTQEVIRGGGVVYGAVQIGLFDTRHVRAAELEHAEAFRRSKYQESDMDTIYRQVKSDLDAGRHVLFTGVGCQIAGLYGFLGKKPDQLITCDMVCHGVPSLRLFKEYIWDLERVHGGKAVRIVYRDKTRGWKHNQIAITMEDDQVIKEWSMSHAYHSCYLSGLISRPSCDGCRYQSLSRASDITLADFWRYEGDLLEEYEEHGISLVVCSTKTGQELFVAASPLLNAEKVSVEQAVNSSPHLTKPAAAHPWRGMFCAACRLVGFMMTHRAFCLCRMCIKLPRRCRARAGRDLKSEPCMAA